MTSIQNKLIAKVAIHQIFKDENSDSQQIVNNSKKRMLKLLKIILKNNPSFGVFTTIDRSPETKRKANTELVHGCHGTFGDGGYKPLTSEEMLTHILDKVYSSAHSDSRKNQFRQPLKEDLKGNLKIALLKLPLYEINYNTGRISELNNQIFKNDKLGFIMDKNGSKATYLPYVFPDKSWQQIRDHLVQQKAGTSLDNKIKFYAYKTYDIKSTIDEALKLNLSNLNTISKKPITTNITHTSRTSGSTNKLKKYSKSQSKTKKKITTHSRIVTLINRKQLLKIYNFFKENYKTNIPYEVSSLSDNNINISVRISPTDYVRNYASYSDILKLLKLLHKSSTDILNSKVKNSILKLNKQFISERRQAYPFLLISMYKMNKDRQFTNFINKIENMLYKDLQNIDTSNIDMDFELGEIMMGLCKTFKSNKFISLQKKKIRKNILINTHNKMLNDLIDKGYNSEDIFRYNWHCQTVCQYYNTFFKLDLKEKNKSNLLKHVNLLKKYLHQYFNENKLNMDSLETNYLAVTFEAYTGLVNILRQENKSIVDIILKVEKIKKILDTRFTKYGLFKFKSGSSRIDITGHIINGVFNLYNY